MKLLKFIMINCQESTMLSSKEQEISLTISEKVKQKIHLLLCGPCNYFAKQLRLMNESLKKASSNSSISFSESKKQNLQEKINQNNTGL